MAGHYRICVVCSGNICRSAMAEVVLRDAFEREGMGQSVQVDSVGTGAWHVGDGADERALATLHAAGYDGSAHRARHLDPAWLGERDLVLCADDGHLRTVRRLGRGVGTPVHLLREFDPEAGADLDLADPYYGSSQDFESCLTQIERSVPGIVAHVREQLT